MERTQLARGDVEAKKAQIFRGDAGAAPALERWVEGESDPGRAGVPTRTANEGHALHRHHVALSWIGLVAALGFPCLPVAKWVDEFAGIGNLVGYEIIWWAVVGLLLAYVRIVERRPMSSLGLRALTKGDLLAALATAPAMVAVLAVIYFAVFPLMGVSESPEISKLLATPLWWRIISVARAAVGEEVLFRGYAIERLEGLTGSRWVAGAVSCVVFAIAHVGPWGWSHLLVAGVGGVLLTGLYLWRRNLWSNIICHAIVDGVAVVSG